jgi:hypothetical protein
LLCLLIARATLNVAVAWAGVIFSSPQIGTTKEGWEDNRVNDREGFWYASASSSILITSVYVHHVSLSMFESSGIAPRSLLPPWVSEYATPRPGAGGRNGDEDLRFALASGWPSRSLWYEQHRDPAIQGWKTLGGHEFRPATRDRYSILPLCPLWPGFAVNTLFYAGVLWVMSCGPFVLRRMIRRRHGRCPACAYPIGQSPVCTECGAALTPR